MPSASCSYAAELVALSADVILVTGSLGRLARCCGRPQRTDRLRRSPIRSARALSRAWRGRAATSPVSRVRTDYGGKWLELLKEVATRRPTRVRLVNPDTSPQSRLHSRYARPALARRVQACRPRCPRDRRVRARPWRASRERPNGGLIVPSDAISQRPHRDLIYHSGGAARDRLPVYRVRDFAEVGGLMSYGADPTNSFRQAGDLRRSHPQGRQAGRSAGPAADQVRARHQPQDRQGARPRQCPPTLLARADEVIE